MKIVILLFAALATGIAVTQLVDDPGYVLISRQPWSVELTLGIFLLALLILFGDAYLLIRFLINLFHTPARLGRWSQQRQTRLALETQHDGLSAVVNGDWAKAKKLLLKNVDRTPHPSINYLACAWAAQQQGDTDERDNWLAHASQDSETDELTTGILQARLQVQAGQAEQALATANSLHASSPGNITVISILLPLLEQAGEWASLLSVLKTAEKHAALTEDELTEINRRVIDKMLSSSTNLDELDTRINLISKKQRKDQQVIASMARALNMFEEFDRSEALLRGSIKNQWSEMLVSLYGETRCKDACSQLKHAEAWTGDHPLNSTLMLTLGRLAMRAQLWGMARSYLEVAVHNGDNAEAMLEMGWLLETLNEGEQARQMFRRGLEMTTGNTRDQSIPDQITRINTTSDEPVDTSVTHAPSLVYSNESK